MFFDNLFDYTVCTVNTVNIEIVTFLCFLFLVHSFWKSLRSWPWFNMLFDSNANSQIHNTRLSVYLNSQACPVTKNNQINHNATAVVRESLCVCFTVMQLGEY